MANESYPRRLQPRILHEDVAREAPPRPKHRRSRDGCTTCKARRRKCDETKPSCSQCSRRRVVCGGYEKDLKWKEFETRSLVHVSKCTRTRSKKPDHPQHLSNASHANRNEKLTGNQRPDDVVQHGSWASEAESRPVGAVHSPEVWDFSIFDSQSASLDVDAAFSTFSNPSEQVIDLDFLLSDTKAVTAPSFQFEVHPGVSDYLGVYEPPSFLSSHPPGLDGSNVQPNLHIQSVLFEDGGRWSTRFDSTPSSWADVNGPGVFSLYETPRIHDDSPESIALLFDRRICEVLCIKETSTGNPWRQIVWPLAKDHAALYHAVAAMTCFQGSNGLPQFRAKGLQHLDESIRILSIQDETSMHLEVTLTVSLALAFAQTWYYPRSSTGISHIKKAKSLLQKAVSRHLAFQQPSGNLPCLSFLANTWIYMDVIARITCNNVQALDSEFMTACSLFIPSAGPMVQIDPLMGCAGTLFPLIGRVADLVSRVRRSQDRLNSPAIVAHATELKSSLERWAPSMGLDTASDIESVTSSVMDLVQTAKAYKWATLLLLHQAVPELPTHLSFSALAQKILVLLATVPLGSRAIIFPILPLMVAGCEAKDKEDRHWVRGRWQRLSSSNSSGIVDRCLELTSEVWRRRDNYEKSMKTTQSMCDGAAPSTRYFPSLEVEDLDCAIGHREDIGTTAFPPSSAFTYAQDPRLVTGGAEYSVKSQFHWLGVMEEWGWEVMLG